MNLQKKGALQLCSTSPNTMNFEKKKSMQQLKPKCQAIVELQNLSVNGEIELAVCELTFCLVGTTDKLKHTVQVSISCN